MSPREPARRQRQHVFFDAEAIEEWLQYYRSMEGELPPMLDFIRKSIPHQGQAFERNRPAEDPQRTSGKMH